MKNRLWEGKDIYESLENQGKSKEEIWQIFQKFDIHEIPSLIEEEKEFKNTENNLFVEDAIVRKVRLPLDAPDEMIWEWKFFTMMEEEVATFIRKLYPHTGKLLERWLLKAKRNSIGSTNQEKNNDWNPFTDGWIWSVCLGDHRVAFFVSTRTELNNAEIDVVIYPKLIIRLLENITKKAE